MFRPIVMIFIISQLCNPLPKANSLKRVDLPYRVNVAPSGVRILPGYSLLCPLHLLFLLFHLPSVTCYFTVQSQPTFRILRLIVMYVH